MTKDEFLKISKGTNLFCGFTYEELTNNEEEEEQ